MRIFDLWLDESGDFNGDDKKVARGYNPSFIGGVLVEKGKLSQNQVNQMIKSESFHCRDIHDEEGWREQFSIFRKITEMDLKIVLFSNEECITILDSTTTYKNIMVEGILKLIKYLKAKYGEIRLEILLDKRRDTTQEQKTYIDSMDYIKSIAEKIVLRERSVSGDDFIIEDGSAEKNKFLMVADIVCNTIMTRKSRKFLEEEWKYIDGIYHCEDKTKKFAVLQDAIEASFYDLMSAGQMGEAVAVLCQSRNDEILKKCFGVVDENLHEMPDTDIEFHFEFIKLLIQYDLNIERDYVNLTYLIDNLLKYFLPVLCNHFADNLLKKMELEIKFFMLTLYTHMGDVIKAEACIRECDTLIMGLEDKWELLEYRIKYSHRRFINTINMFDFNQALQEVETLVKRCRTLKDAIEVLVEEREIKFVELAKALGSQVQIYTFLLRDHPTMYEKAVEISDAAISEFDKEADKERQYLYRSQLETEKQEFDNALRYLYKANALSEEAQLKDLAKKAENNVPYGFSAYIRLMAEGTVCGWKRAENMYDLISKSHVLPNIMKKPDEECDHPYEIILWKWGSYELNNGMSAAGRKKLEKAVNICFQKDTLTLDFIGMAILLEEYAFVLRECPKEQREVLRKVKKKYEDLYRRELPESMLSIYQDIQFDNADWNYFYRLSRKITY